MFCWRNAPLWNQSSPFQPSTIGENGTATLSAGCGCTTDITTVYPSYDPPMVPTRPFDSGTFFTSQSMVSYASVAWSVLVWLSGPISGRVITYSPSEPYFPRTSWYTMM